MSHQTTTLEPSFLTAVLFLAGFKPRSMALAQAGLLALGLDRKECTAADLDPTITQGSKHLAGAATGALVAMGLLVVVGRCKSPRENAKGRKLDVLAIPAHRRSTAKVWLTRNGFAANQPADGQEAF